MHVLWMMLVKTRGIKYFNVETWMLFVPSYQDFWLRAWLCICENEATIGFYHGSAIS